MGDDGEGESECLLRESTAAGKVRRERAMCVMRKRVRAL